MSGGGDAGLLEEALYEGYGPGGVAIMLQALTDNKQRTVSDIRASFNKAGGNLGDTGCVSWNFEFKGVITAEVQNDDTDEVALAVIDAGADDFRSDGSYLEVYANANSLEIFTYNFAKSGSQRHVSRNVYGPTQYYKC